MLMWETEKESQKRNKLLEKNADFFMLQGTVKKANESFTFNKPSSTFPEILI